MWTLNIFGYWVCVWGGGGLGASIIRLGPSWFTSTSLFYINLHVKYGSNLIRTFWVEIQNMKKKIRESWVALT